MKTLRLGLSIVVKTYLRLIRRSHFKREFLVVLSIILIVITGLYFYNKSQKHIKICLRDIDYVSSSKGYRYDYVGYRSERKYFKEQEEALDYCLRARC